jgi:protein-tyrosine phosphatase
MSYQHLLTSLGVVLVIFGFVEGGWFWSAVWLGCDFLVLGVARARGLHGIFGKRADGTLPAWSWLLFFPLLAYTTIIWHLIRLFTRKPAWNAVTDQLVVGRRLLTFEHEGEFDNFVDLTAEFSEPSCIRRSSSYHSFPILDGGAPNPEKLRAAVERLRPGRTFVHCAQGHGRTGLFALAMLLHSGTVRTVEEGMQILSAVRPGIRLNKEQHRCTQAYAQQIARFEKS